MSNLEPIYLLPQYKEMRDLVKVPHLVNGKSSPLFLIRVFFTQYAQSSHHADSTMLLSSISGARCCKTNN